MEWELPRPGKNIPVTVFAGDDELLAFLHHEPHERIIMSEIIDKAYMREPAELAGDFEHCAMVSPYPSDVVPATLVLLHRDEDFRLLAPALLSAREQVQGGRLSATESLVLTCHLVSVNEEFRAALTQEEERLHERSRQLEASAWIEPSRDLFFFSHRARFWLLHGDNDVKQVILSTVGSNLLLRVKKLSIDAKKPFSIVRENRSCCLLRAAAPAVPRRAMAACSATSSAALFSCLLISCLCADVRTLF
jgi:hypothetical protein